MGGNFSLSSSQTTTQTETDSLPLSCDQMKENGIVEVFVGGDNEESEISIFLSACDQEEETCDC